MIRITRQATLKNASHVPKALSWATELNGYLNKKYNAEIHFGMELFGALHMTWFVDRENIAALDSLNQQLMNDKQYWSHIEKGKEFWVDGSLKDTVVQMAV